MRELRWRPRARLDRESIAIYLGMECGSPEAALDTIRGIDEAIARALEFPESGRTVRIDDLEHADYRSVVSGKYTVYYRFDDVSLVVYRILHQRRDIDDYALIDFQSRD